MSKRTKVMIRTREADALRKLRELEGLSVRKVGDILGISHTMVSHLELGRANISEEYIKKFLKTFNFTNEEWKIFVEGAPKKGRAEKQKLLEECTFMLRGLPEEKLKLIQSMLCKLS